ncbi:hypothetical protein ACFW35_16580 [Fictibacillus sp. NPDC058756]|uniref:hypothetical protein n=1 Tax=Fictibacillus sp. NPDC058756 TaxID=3346625 RepID=UPI00368DAC02
MDERNMQEQCKKHIGANMLLETTDGQTVDGIIEGTEDPGVTMMVSEEMNTEDREFVPGGFGGDDDFHRRRFPFPFIRRIFYYPYYYPTGYAPPYVYSYPY